MIIEKTKKFILTFLAFYLAIIAFLYFFQRNLQYLPTTTYQKIENYNLPEFVEKKIITSDKIEIISWYKKPQKNQKTIIYFHGNAGNISTRINRYKMLAKNFGVLAVSYRGYFGKKEKITEKAIFEDANSALNFLIIQENLKPQDIILYGESLGSGVATYLAQNKDLYALILESPFSSILSVAKTRYSFAPVELLLKDKFRSDKFVKNIVSPILIFHGTSDKVVKYEEGEKLFKEIVSPKKMISVKNAGHLDFSEEFLLKNILEFLEEKK